MNRQLPLRFKLEDHVSLDDYVGSTSTRLLELKNLVILYGDAGSGKSHLLQGLCNQVVRSSGSAFYLPMSSSLKPSILQGLEDSDLVCLDDIDNILQTSSWQTALFHLINACGDNGVKLVLSSSQPVISILIELPDLLSRLKSAYFLSTGQLSDTEKLEVLRVKAQRRGFEMGSDVCSFILSRSPRDMHYLVRLVERLDEATLSRQKKVTIPFVKRTLGL